MTQIYFTDVHPRKRSYKEDFLEVQRKSGLKFLPFQQESILQDFCCYSFSHNHGSVKNTYIWKVTILLEIHPFLTEPWLLWEENGCFQK